MDHPPVLCAKIHKIDYIIFASPGKAKKQTHEKTGFGFPDPA
jgi:hypothetical protein